MGDNLGALWTAPHSGNTYYKSAVWLDTDDLVAVDGVTYRVVSGLAWDSDWYLVERVGGG